ncbi:hypothetical protein DM480_11140 [Sphingomonas sp. FARSPH]|jgi:hypothetical protein|nr:hypothetical protein DM480_11140 [Sphingomonas sp. FARSPH]
MSMTKTFRIRALGLIAAGLVLPTLAGCSRSPSEEAPAETVQNDATVTEVAPNETMPAMANAAEPVPAGNAMAAEAPPPPPPARGEDQQMLDDASITGMTARVQRDAAPSDAPSPTDAAPAGNAE